jgi:drug/metabolite transporter (DMT)-like permease
MTFTAILLIFTSAFMHAFWNLIGKRQQASLAFFTVTAVTSNLLTFPLLLIYRQSLPAVSPTVWVLLVATGIAQTIYILGLTTAYRHGDISLVYPLARSIPILLVIAVTFAIGKGSAIGPLSLFGMLLIITGCIILPLQDFRRLHLRHYASFAYLMILVTAIGTAGYTLIDDEALRQLRQSSTISLTDTEVTLFFIPLQGGSTALMMSLATLFFPSERQEMKRLLTRRSSFLSAVSTGLIIMTTYSLVLAAMAHVTHVSYVAAFRQLSIPIGAVFGMTLLHEPRYKPKISGILIISAGLILVGIG